MNTTAETRRRNFMNVEKIYIKLHSQRELALWNAALGLVQEFTHIYECVAKQHLTVFFFVAAQ